METITRDGDITNGNANTDSDTNAENPLKLLKEEYYELMYRYKSLALIDKDIEISKKDLALKKMGVEILNLQQYKLNNELVQTKNKKDKIKKELNSFRDKIAARLGIKSLDEYLLDDVTYELSHESKLESVIAENKLKSIGL